MCEGVGISCVCVQGAVVCVCVGVRGSCVCESVVCVDVEGSLCV